MDQFWASLLIVGHVLAAGAVTRHVLLTHRDVRSSFGWIGLSWLSPFIGSTIYIVFGVNWVARHGSRIKLPQGRKGLDGVLDAEKVLGKGHPPSITSIARAGDNISGLPLTQGNALDIFCNGDVAYPIMLEAIDKAKHSIALSSYIFASDATGHAFVDRLIAAKTRGVEVRVLVDGIGSGYFRARIVEELRAGGVNVEQFLHDWKLWIMTFINLRNHKKLLIIDGKLAFTGGMNIADENVSVNGGQPEVQDVHARVEGPVVSQLMLTFARDWEFTTSEALEGDAWWPKLSAKGEIVMRGITSGPDNSMGRIEATLATAIEQATERVRIVTPYFLPEDRLFGVLRLAAVRGVEVEVVIPAVTNHFYFNWAITAHLATFPFGGIKYYLTPAPFDHTKLMSVDGRWASFGSANWDARSMRLNFEFQMECYDTKAVADIDAVITDKIEGARLLTTETLEQRSTLVKLRDASARLFLPYL